MKINRFAAREKMSLVGFADRHKLEMDIREVIKGELYEAHFHDVKLVVNGKPPIKRVGLGETEHDAIRDYSQRISTKTIVVERENGKKETIEVPDLEC